MRRAAGRPGLVCLRGRFAGGHPVLTSHPVQVLPRGVRPPTSEVAAGAADAADGHGDARAPVAGGWFGVLGFDAATTRFAFHDHVVRRVDGRWRFESLWTSARADELTRRRAEWAQLIAAADEPPDGPGWTLGAFTGADETAHLAAVERAVELIRAGELYQVNVCTRVTAPFTGSPAALFAAAAQRLDPAYGAFVADDDAAVADNDDNDADDDGPSAVACLSPELFLRRRGREVRSRPIKGTLPDGPGNSDALRRSAKDVAENVMIVDLVRNDLGRVCATGSVRASGLLQVVPHVGVLHLVSEVRGRLRRDVTDTDLLDALFPPGSVTGAPKLRAVDAIADLEPVPRRAYTGAVGFVSPCWGAEFAVAIRTLEIGGGAAALGVGGGVTADSVPVLEWRECLHKAAPIVAAAGGSLAVGDEAAPGADLTAGLVETVLGLDGVAVRVADHLGRLDRSLRELHGCGVAPGLADDVRAAAARVPVGRAAVRVVAGSDGRATVTVTPARRPPAQCDAVVVTRAAACWRHKWADRAWAGTAERAAGTAVPLFVAADGTVLETSRGNVFLVDDDGTLVTPPLRDDLLPGVTRRALLDLARDTGRPARLRTFGVDELVRRPAFWTSSLSGAVPIRRVGDVDLPRADALVEHLGRALRHR